MGYDPVNVDLMGVEEINIALQSSTALSDEVVLQPFGTRVQHTDDGDVSVEPVMGWLELEQFIENNM